MSIRFRLSTLVAGAVLTLPLAGVVNSAQAADAAAGKVVFKQQCSICHADVANQNKIGPSLFGVVGRHSGEVPGYSYSPANKKSGITWTAAELNQYLKAPQKVVPGTKMPYAGLKNATKRANLIAFLATLKK